ncbi:hypothetical protein [Nostocoides sp. HKS02]|uniref:hypothetical protein n=1 Tax=Nostocoides sp. HKS02 TaxID=1813880 RepID=UPI0018A8061A|nr:hypothetical protein [Tetrasphaera sp. HKS02]
MTLLTSMMERPLDPGYAAAAQARAEAGLPASTGIRTPVVLVAALVTGLLLTVGGLALRTPSTSAVKARSELIAQIQSRRKAADAQETALRTLQAEVDSLQSQALGQDRGAVTSRLAALSLAAGAEAVTGPGIRVVLDDAPSAHGNKRRRQSPHQRPAERRQGAVQGPADHRRRPVAGRGRGDRGQRAATDVEVGHPVRG